MTLLFQCIMPAFEGLLPLADDQTVADLLFELANWHALAKLRLHTSVTVDILRAATEDMCRVMRHFARTTCKNHNTHELPKETEARVRREGKRPGEPSRAPKIVRFNVLNTYKYHSLPDYPDYIQDGGTTDNGNTQVVRMSPADGPCFELTNRRCRSQAELEHRHAKRYYRRTNKIRYAMQIAKHQRRATLLRALRELDDYVPRRERLHNKRGRHPLQSKKRHAPAGTEDTQAGSDDEEEEDPPLPTPPLEHYAISQTRRMPIRLATWLTQNKGDPATKACTVEDYELAGNSPLT